MVIAEFSAETASPKYDQSLLPVSLSRNATSQLTLENCVYNLNAVRVRLEYYNYTQVYYNTVGLAMLLIS